jgi:hypothetical protein
MKEFARKRACVVLHEQVVNGVSATHAAHSGPAGDAHTQSKNMVRADIFDLGEADAVFVAKREIAEQVFEGVNAALGQEFGALRANTFDHADIGLQAIMHKGFYIISPHVVCTNARRSERLLALRGGV